MDQQERNITDEERNAVKELLFGSTEENFSQAWLDGFQFNSTRYALRQRLPGPCGVIASVQAFIIYELLFGEERVVLKHGLLRPTYAKKKKALSGAICGILWQAKTGNHVVVARREVSTIYGEQIKLRSVTDYSLLRDYVHQNIQRYIERGGFINFMYSLILTRGVDIIKEDMDSRENTLIGDEDSYCTQEIINLILTGRAVTNIFDEELIIGDGNERMVLRGITQKPKIGFLASTADNSFVGDFYQNPECPIFVLYGSNHYFVLFGTTRTISDPPFNLFYVNSLTSNLEIRLHIRPKIGPNDPDDAEIDELPSTVRCILSRWPNSSVQVEPITNK